MNGVLRKRTKVQRGSKSMKTPLAEGQRIACNFVGPQTVLKRQIPAEAASVGVEVENKWLELLTRALEARQFPKPEQEQDEQDCANHRPDTRHSSRRSYSVVINFIRQVTCHPEESQNLLKSVYPIAHAMP